jgi:hypothetical protein
MILLCAELSSAQLSKTKDDFCSQDHALRSCQQSMLLICSWKDICCNSCRAVLVCRRNGKVEVVEYSEISAEQKSARDTWGRLQYNWSNVCMHYFSLAWLTKVVKHLEKNGSKYAPMHACTDTSETE